MMSVESALSYIRRMRDDDDFRRSMNEISDDDDAAWAQIQAAGFTFTMEEFRAAQEKMYEEHGVTPP
jgi:predicted ribosomally synthesized peptide with nif11-like leader